MLLESMKMSSKRKKPKMYKWQTAEVNHGLKLSDGEKVSNVF